MTHKEIVSEQEIEHVRLHVWELKQLIEKMERDKNPEAARLKSILARFVKGDPNLDRA